MPQGYTGGFGSRGGKNYWYDAIQSLQPYYSQYRPEAGKVTESDILGKSRRLDEDTKQLIERLKLEQLERDYEEQELAAQKGYLKKAQESSQRQTIGTAAITAAKGLTGTKLGEQLLSQIAKIGATRYMVSGSSMPIELGFGAAAASALPQLLLAYGAFKWAQSLGFLPGLGKNLFKPNKWRL